MSCTSYGTHTLTWNTGHCFQEDDSSEPLLLVECVEPLAPLVAREDIKTQPQHTHCKVGCLVVVGEGEGGRGGRGGGRRGGREEGREEGREGGREVKV